MLRGVIVVNMPDRTPEPVDSTSTTVTCRARDASMSRLVSGIPQLRHPFTSQYYTRKYHFMRRLRRAEMEKPGVGSKTNGKPRKLSQHRQIKTTTKPRPGQLLQGGSHESTMYCNVSAELLR
ncbi:hypothetical protein RRG08_057007 [Elysia crispata]|uniref:Uncharacterized protein n=1 Tax=Elysia crispata TaxID=231223 RepID=A0AAE0Z692_9GAST|nr:hypothetical protein RRG08_057007 [Elysia crispata]